MDLEDLERTHGAALYIFRFIGNWNGLLDEQTVERDGSEQPGDDPRRGSNPVRIRHTGKACAEFGGARANGGDANPA